MSKIKLTQALTDEVKTGDIVKECPVTGEAYRVTEWIERGDRVIALEKELIEDV